MRPAEMRALIAAAATAQRPHDALKALSVEWIGHDQEGLCAREIEDLLHEYVDEVESSETPAVCHVFEDDLRGLER